MILLPALLLLSDLLSGTTVVGQDFVSGERAPGGTGQLQTAPALFKAGVDDQGRHYFLNGQPAKNSRLILTASNGFFDNGTCRAGGESLLPKIGDDSLIQPNFAYLDQWKKTSGTIRWHLWLPKPGTLRMSVNMRVSGRQAGSQLTVSLAGKSQTVTTLQSLPDTPQPWDLAFDVTEPGEHTVSLTAEKISDIDSGVGELHSINVFGAALKDSQLLRARWRPAAVHGSYSCSKVKQSRMWVMTTRSMCEFSSYSPITTPFGYYGTSFEADRRTSGGFNFSMWAAGSRGKVPPLDQMPHLLAAGSPQAEFSGFGHEGSGVKLREWIPMPDRPKLCVQALRVESDGNYDTYHGYFWDHPTRRWKLYAVGRKWNGGKAKEHLSPGSFCEIPGPPQVQRSGDRVREVRRRGWCYGDDDRWHAMDTFQCKSKEPSNKFWYTTAEGEFAMGTGGMRYYDFKQPPAPETQQALPEFLTPEATRQLYRLPAEINEVKAINVASTSAAISLSMTRAGTNSRVEVYYGESDCMTFAKRKLHGTERNSAVSKSTQADKRSWSHSNHAVPLKDGKNQVILKDLKPETTYYYRALIMNDEGKLWTFKTKSFRTKSACCHQ
ncbi:DUF3472 domain-containing protein [Novipirellula artificiosorum]|uniref:DUF3472 domain-containing protein n=1 Tax=Novipirellula artificiosorum TaxID=2528016 RepID=UPI001E4B9569|nr:hypothetical protein [Novipirellula artificiosorum]